MKICKFGKLRNYAKNFGRNSYVHSKYLGIYNITKNWIMSPPIYSNVVLSGVDFCTRRKLNGFANQNCSATKATKKMAKL